MARFGFQCSQLGSFLDRSENGRTHHRVAVAFQSQMLVGTQPTLTAWFTLFPHHIDAVFSDLGPARWL